MKTLDEYIYFLAKRGNFESLLRWYFITDGGYYILWSSVVWLLLYSKNKGDDPVYIRKAVLATFFILVGIVTLRYISMTIRMKLVGRLERENQEFIISLLHDIPKCHLINLDLANIACQVRLIGDSFPIWLNMKISLVNILSKVITVLIALKKVNVFLILALLVTIQVSFYFVKGNIIKKEIHHANRNTKLELQLRQQVENSRTKIINGTFNRDHLCSMLNDYASNYQKVENSRINLSFYSGLSVIIVTGIIVFVKYETIPLFTKFLYLLVVKDISQLFDLTIDFYRTSTVLERVNDGVRDISALLDLIEQPCPLTKSSRIEQFTLDKFENITPDLKLVGPVKFEKGNPTLLEGKSGCGKSTLLKALKGINDEAVLETTPAGLSKDVYFCSQSSRPYKTKTLYEYITNASKTPDRDLVQRCLRTVCLDHIYKGQPDEKMSLSRLSGGEQTRLSLAQILYEVLTTDYSIIILDEMDANLDTELAMRVFTNVLDLLKEKILIFVVHNDTLKSLFKQVVKFDGNKIQNYDSQ